MEQGRPEEEEEGVVVDDVRFHLSQHLLDVLRVAGPHLSVFQPREVELEHLAVLPVQLLHQLVSASLVARTYESQPVPNSGCWHLFKWFEANLRRTAGQGSDKNTASAGPGCHCQSFAQRPYAVEHHS